MLRSYSSRSTGNGESREPHLWIAPAAGGAPRLLSDVRGGGPIRWAPGGAQIGFVVWGDERPALWLLDLADNSARKVLDDVVDFGWYRDDRHVIVRTYNPRGLGEMRAVDLESGAHVTLLKDPQIELIVAPDGSAVSYCSAVSHYNMNLHILRLAPTDSGLPQPVGPPEKITHGDGEWHVHNGDWSPDQKRIVYTRDTDTADMYMLEGVFADAQ